MNKRKILNDPVHGFITIPNDFIFEIMNRPCVQRLTRIRQLGLTYLVYPGAIHTRFNHALGAMHLMNSAIEVLKQKGFDITADEKNAALAAILLHDVGHGPFSHALESSLIHKISHENISLFLMKNLNKNLNGKLDIAIEIFKGTYKKKYLHQLVTSQLDVDRLDYLTRDSFFTGVSEGVIGTERLIKMMTIANDELAVEEKGIYSVERFIVSRRLMYWQVYFHKTVLAAEQLLIAALSRAHYLALNGANVFATPALNFFLKNNISISNIDDETLDNFIEIDDSDILSALKVWQYHNDKILSTLAHNLLNRKLFRVVIESAQNKINEDKMLKKEIANKYNISIDDAHYFFGKGEIKNDAYNPDTDKIWIHSKDGQRRDITDVSDQLFLGSAPKIVVKKFVYFPK